MPRTVILTCVAVMAFAPTATVAETKLSAREACQNDFLRFCHAAELVSACRAVVEERLAAKK
jgi:hypothetical protein